MSDLVRMPVIQNQSMNEIDSSLRTNPLDPSTWIFKYGDCLLRCALSRVRYIENAEDLVQETFLAALRSRHTFIGESSEKTWLISILKHKVVDYYRANHGRKAVGEFMEMFDDESDYGEYGCEDNQRYAGSISKQPIVYSERPQVEGRFDEWKVDPGHRAQQDEFWKALHGCLAKLSPRIAGAFWLREVEQLDTQEICENLNISEANLWVMLHRARRCLRECLQSNWLKKAA